LSDFSAVDPPKLLKFSLQNLNRVLNSTSHARTSLRALSSRRSKSPAFTSYSLSKCPRHSGTLLGADNSPHLLHQKMRVSGCYLFLTVASAYEFEWRHGGLSRAKQDALYSLLLGAGM